ncbi:hypothetical protein LRS74_12755 [Streptomyces sp. LX-29]|uniref:hypothetical protein n=1 Tax=Streptomyces sp. LX-29 TaxID=2900152 RepID=UPI00240DB2F4|nr:hypothetical protein [Streptomyces sp. LX-29]WFB07816.1 hypothetical protein LRS74_12755 [Streptomyces sp. LX-29]
MKRTHRLAVAATLAAALLTGGAATAMAATAPAKPAPVKTAPAKPQAKTTITAKSSVDIVRAWQEFRVTGKTTGIKAGSKVSLQQKQRGKWVTLPASTVVNKSGAYSLRVKLGAKGKNELRMASGSTHSAAFTVAVR